MSTGKKILDLIPASLHEDLFKEVLEKIEEKKQFEKNRPRTPEEEKEFQKQVDEILNKL